MQIGSKQRLTFNGRMGTMYEPLPEIHEPVSELEMLRKRERDLRLRPRLHLLILIASGQVRTRIAAAERLEVHRNTVGQWLSAYKAGGISGLRTVEKTGAKARQRSVPLPVWEELQARLAADGFDSYLEVQRWLAEAQGIALPYGTVHHLVRYRLGAKLKRARPVHGKKTLPKQKRSPDA